MRNTEVECAMINTAATALAARAVHQLVRRTGEDQGKSGTLMAKSHKLFWTGIDIETSLDTDLVWVAVAEAIAQVKGKFHLAADAPLQKTYDIKGSETLFATSPELTFEVQISDEFMGRRAIRTRVIQALLKDGSIPFGPRKMLGQKAYMKFAQALGVRVAHVDPASVASLREGPMPDGFALNALATRPALPATAV
jgi:hypothetical protein